jgi:SAM-dependent methyltransferase
MRTRVIAVAALLAGILAGCERPPARPVPPAPPAADAAPEPAAMATTVAKAAPADPPPADAYGTCDATPDGTGITYFGREVASYMTHHGIPWLERDSREAEERTSALLDALELRPGLCVADIGAGSGRLTVPIARRISPGIAYGTDIQPEMLRFLEARARSEGLPNLKGILGDTDDVMLPEGSVDLVLLVDAYHEFDRPWEMTRSMVRALRPGGRVALVEFRAEDPEVPIKALHKMTESQARRELEAAGLRWVRTDPRLPWQHLLWFEKPAGPGAAGVNPG